MMRKFLISLLSGAFLFPVSGYSDVVEEGETPVFFKITNLAEFSSYQFFYYYQDYYYSEGHHAGDQIFTLIEEGEEYQGGDKGSSAVIMARLKSDTTQIFETEASFGGTEIINGRRVDHILDEIKIKAIEGELIKVKSKRFEIHEDGERIESNGGFLGGIHGGPFQLFGINGLMWLMPLAALLSLTLFFFWRKNITRKPNAGFAA